MCGCNIGEGRRRRVTFLLRWRIEGCTTKHWALAAQRWHSTQRNATLQCYSNFPPSCLLPQFPSTPESYEVQGTRYLPLPSHPSTFLVCRYVCMEYPILHPATKQPELGHLDSGQWTLGTTTSRSTRNGHWYLDFPPLILPSTSPLHCSTSTP